MTEGSSWRPTHDSPGRERDIALPTRVVVMGSGSWGTAAAGLIARHARQVVICARRARVAEGINATGRNPSHLSDYLLPDNVSCVLDHGDALRDAEALVLAVPSAYLRASCLAMRPNLAAGVPVCLLTKGLDPKTGDTLAHVVEQTLAGEDGDSPCANGPVADAQEGHSRGPSRVAVLSGPNHAEEICEGLVSAAVIASENASVAMLFQRLFACVSFRPYATDDVTGVSLCGAMKNVIAIAAGIACGLGLGDNALSVLMTRGLAEMGRLVAACGGNPLTCMGLAGMGDLVATCTSSHSRNRAFGMELVHGTTVASYETERGVVVEGAAAVPGIIRLACAHGVETPMAEGINAILYGGASIDGVVSSLLMRPASNEFYGFTGPGLAGFDD